MRRPNSPRPRPRTGFTLIELLVVVVILALLVGLLVPAVMRAVGTARDAAVAAEINSLAQALADFKNKYGEYPPSRIVLCENGNYSTANVTAYPNLIPRSLTALRKYWPRVLLSTQGTPAVISASFFYDFNGNGTADTTPYVISGAECLVFFLGGIPQTGSNVAVTGFARNPANPFQNAATASNRVPPLFEFKSTRLGDFDGNGMPEYHDSYGGDATQGIYYYYSAYSGAGYDPDDDTNSTTNGYQEADDSGTIPNIAGGFMTSNAATPLHPGTTFPARPDFVSSYAPNPYVLGDFPVPTTGGSADTSNYKPRPYANPQSFQIISPGPDRLYGIGGAYITSAQSANPLPFAVQANTDVTTQTLGTDIRTRERDNITNFSTGRLQ